MLHLVPLTITVAVFVLLALRLRAVDGERRFLRLALAEIGDHVVVCGPDGASLGLGPSSVPEAVSGSPLHRALHGEVVQDSEVTVPQDDGDRHFLVNGTAVHDGDGRLLGAIMTSIDVTERRRAVDSVRDYARSLRAISEAVASGGADGNGRDAICRAVADVVGGHLVVLWEPDGEGDLVATAWVGPSAENFTLPIHPREPTGTVRCFLSGRPEFLPDVRAGEVRTSVADDLSIASALFHPVRRGDRTVGVLAIGWPWPVAELPDRVAQTVGVIAGEAAGMIERAELLELLRAESRTDPLTGLPNRRAWDEELEREMARAARHDYPLSVALVDLDHFKRYNDRLGHQAGDRLLRSVAAAWRGTLRDVDGIARWGGEEFAVALPNCDAVDAIAVLDRLRAVVPDAETCSIGVITWDGVEGSAELMARADERLYGAKQAGRDCVVGD